MKIRQGFVSNSSTSSFLIYGCTVDDDQITEMYLKKFPEKEIDEDEYASELLYELFESKEFKGSGLNSWHPDYSDTFVGRSWASIDDNETGKQFKDSVEKQLKELFGGDIKCETFKEAWHD
jgi:hypothetical protein